MLLLGVGIVWLFWRRVYGFMIIVGFIFLWICVIGDGFYVFVVCFDFFEWYIFIRILVFEI